MIIGVTGHQELKGVSLKRWIQKEIQKQINDRKNINKGLSALAIGADQLFARLMIELKIDLHGIIPSYNYEITFNAKNQTEYLRLLSYCKSVKILDFSKPSEQAFFAAGKYIADQSDLLFAIWDGKQANGLGGTGDVVEYALSLGKSIIHLHSVAKTVNILSNKDIIIK